MHLGLRQEKSHLKLQLGHDETSLLSVMMEKKNAIMLLFITLVFVQVNPCISSINIKHHKPNTTLLNWKTKLSSLYQNYPEDDSTYVYF